MFDLKTAERGAKLKTRNDSEFIFIAYVPEAVPSQRLLALETRTLEVHSFWSDGRFMPDHSESSLDLML